MATPQDVDTMRKAIQVLNHDTAAGAYQSPIHLNGTGR